MHKSEEVIFQRKTKNSVYALEGDSSLGIVTLHTLTNNLRPEVEQATLEKPNDIWNNLFIAP